MVKPMQRKTRKAPPGSDKIEHHHLLLRMETKKCPGPEDKEKAELLITHIIRDIGMNLLGKPHVYYVKVPKYNEGLTAIAPIQTSHIAFHFWKNPDPKILKNASSNCLLEFDIYTCGKLTSINIKHIMHHLTIFEPTHADITLLNRKWSLTVDNHMKWDSSAMIPWTKWLDSDRFNN
jgi:S-adenosylmethionine/arginine decarboxylase-like enzyme